MTNSRPFVIAHRGYTADAPENTLAAFEAARTSGADGVELDVRRTADGALAIHHDPAIAGLGLISELPSAALPRQVPFLDQALDACRGLVVNVEIKNHPGEIGHDPTGSFPKEVGACIGEGSNVVVSSFHPADLDVLARSHPGLALGWLLDVRADAHQSLGGAIERGYQALHPFVTQVDQRLVDRAHEAGLAVNVWTVNAVADLQAMVDLGVDGIITDRLHEALQIVGQQAR